MNCLLSRKVQLVFGLLELFSCKEQNFFDMLICLFNGLDLMILVFAL